MSFKPGLSLNFGVRCRRFVLASLFRPRTSHASAGGPEATSGGRLMRAITIVAAAVLAVAASGSAIAQTPTMPAAVHVSSGMLTDAKGMTLYTFDNDKEPNKSA